MEEPLLVRDFSLGHDMAEGIKWRDRERDREKVRGDGRC